jgi:hypothetical protein
MESNYIFVTNKNREFMVKRNINNWWVLAARARPCAARTRLFGLINTPNGALRAPPSQLRCSLKNKK